MFTLITHVYIDYIFFYIFLLTLITHVYIDYTCLHLLNMFTLITHVYIDYTCLHGLHTLTSICVIDMKQLHVYTQYLKMFFGCGQTTIQHLKSTQNSVPWEALISAEWVKVLWGNGLVGGWIEWVHLWLGKVVCECMIGLFWGV